MQLNSILNPSPVVHFVFVMDGCSRALRGFHGGDLPGHRPSASACPTPTVMVEMCSPMVSLNIITLFIHALAISIVITLRSAFCCFILHSVSARTLFSFSWYSLCHGILCSAMLGCIIPWFSIVTPLCHN